MPLSTVQIEEVFTCREEGVKKLLSGILNLNIQDETGEKSIIGILNRLLSTAKHRKEGLEYLNLILNNCSTTIIGDNALNWINYCIIKFPDDVLRELKLRLIGQIIEVAHDEADFNKRFVSDYISKVLDNCITTLQVNRFECKTALTTLTTCLKLYPSWFGAHRQKIENFILIFLDSDNSELIHAAAFAFHYLQQVGGAGTNGVNHKLSFKQNFHKLCRTVHKLYNKFFEHENELFYTEISDNDTFEFEDDPTLSSQAILHVNARRIKNVFKFIETMIKVKYPVAKEIKPKELLEIISRGTSLHKCITGGGIVSLETYNFSLLLLEIQCAALQLLRLSIIWLQTNILPFSYSVSKIIVNSIERSHNCDCYTIDSLYQESAYQVLSEWISISKGSLHSQFQTQLLECILKDITPVKAQVTLTISEAASGKKSQKAKRRAMTSRIINSGNQALNKESTTRYERLSEKNTCQFALTALTCLLESVTFNVKSNLIKDLYKSVFDSLITIQSGKPLRPYTDVQCQVKLYQVLVAIYHQNTLTILPPLHTSLDILTFGSNSRNRFIASVCQDGLRMLESFCQPICPSLYLGLEKEDEEESIRETEAPSLMNKDIEVMEMQENGDEDGSVDYDASTDEMVNHEKYKDGDSSVETYHVRYTDTDRSTIDDVLSEKGTITEEIEVEEIDINVTPDKQNVEHEMKIAQYPVVTAPSEDGNEILEEMEELILNTEENEKEQCESSKEQIDEHSKQSESEIVTSSGPKIDTAEQEQSNSNPEKIGKVEETKEIIIEEQNIEEVCTTGDVKVENTESKAKSRHNDNENEPEEHPAKKPKLMEGVENIIDTTSKNVEDDPDASYLEDDSFVDEVKDYY